MVTKLDIINSPSPVEIRIAFSVHVRAVRSILVHSRSRMPSLSAVRASNKAWKPAFRPVVVVAGGTSGKFHALLRVLIY